MRADRVVVTGGAGFLGSHLCEALLRDECEVVCLDNFVTSTPANIAELVTHPRFRMRFFDVSNELRIAGPVDAVLHFAAPPAPADRRQRPVRTLGTGVTGTWRALELARTKGARLVLASASDVYGQAQIDPQPEHYWGAVDPVGPGSLPAEANRYAEALTATYRTEEDTDTAIVRIFSTFGPRIRFSDGRAIGTFIRQALRGEPLTVTGDGTQIRSACYVTDMVDGILRVARSPLPGPINLGDPQGRSILQTAQDIIAATGSSSVIRFVDRPVDEPALSSPDISLAGQVLGWWPSTSWADGLAASIAWARRSEGLAAQRLPRARVAMDR